MQLIEWPRFLATASPLGAGPSAITVGIFDGVHRGHRALIERVVSYPSTMSVAITFKQSNHKKVQTDGQGYPEGNLGPDGPRWRVPGDILSFRQKTAIFKSLGISMTVVIELTEEFMQMSGPDFLRILGEHGNMGCMAVGNNFRCGHRLDTDAQAIREFNLKQGVTTSIVQSLTEGGEPISSSRIRTAIAAGELRQAAAMLGYPFTVDISDAAKEAAGTANGGVAYNIAAQGRILPPPGKYPVVLLGKNGQIIRRPADVLIAEGRVIVGRNLADGSVCWKFVEFSRV